MKESIYIYAYKNLGNDGGLTERPESVFDEQVSYGDDAELRHEKRSGVLQGVLVVNPYTFRVALIWALADDGIVAAGLSDDAERRVFCVLH